MAGEESGKPLDVEGGEVYVRMMDGSMRPPICEWFKFSTNDDYGEQQLTLFSKYQDPNVRSSVVIAGSCIYRVGGFDGDRCRRPSTAVFRYDTSKEGEEAKWEAAPPMNGAKSTPQVLYTGGKIYAVVRKCCHPLPETIDRFAECFDPSSNQGWVPLVCRYEGNDGFLFSVLSVDNAYHMSILEPGVTILFTCKGGPTFVYRVLDGALIKLDGGQLPYKIKRLSGFLAHSHFGDHFVRIGDFLYSINFYNGSIFCYNPKNDVMLAQPNVLGDDYADKVADGIHAVLPSSGDCSLGLLHLVWLSFDYVGRQIQWKLNYTAIAVPTDINFAGSIGPFGYGGLYGCRVISRKDFILPAASTSNYISLDGLLLVKAGSLLNSQLDMDVSYERVEVPEVVDEVQQNTKYLYKNDIPSLGLEAILSPAISDPSGRNTMTRRDSGTWKRRKHF